jgi:hypothetical protein
LQPRYTFKNAALEFKAHMQNSSIGYSVEHARQWVDSHTSEWDHEKAVSYAHQWAYDRNRRYMDFSGMGGDCTNFISQCLHAGGASMNYTRTFGWYYNSASDRTPSWTGVSYLHNFLISNKGVGPFAYETSIYEMKPGDLVQLAFTPDTFSHSLLVIEVGEKPDINNVLIATHSDDCDHRPLSTYPALNYRCLKINAR